MKISYDSEVDALSIVFRETTVTTKPLADGMTAEYDSEGRLVGIEILDAAGRFGDLETLRQVILEGIGPGLRVWPANTDGVPATACRDRVVSLVEQMLELHKRLHATESAAARARLQVVLDELR